MDQTNRASEIDIILQCGLASKSPKQRIDHTGPEAALGKAVHAALEPWVNGGFEGEPVAQPWANQYGVDPKAVEPLIEAAPDAIRSIREDLANVRAEVKIKGGGVRGIIDVLSLMMAQTKLFSVGVIDWKTGRDPSEGSKPGQRLGYASAVEATYGMPATRYIYSAEVWLATGDVLESRYDLDTIEGFRTKLAEQLKYQSASPGKCCRYCGLRYECEARKLYTRAAVDSLVALEPNEITPDDLANLWDKSRAVKRALELYETMIDLQIEQDGHLSMPDGRRMVFGKRTRETIDARKAWPIMRKVGLSNDEINAIVGISKTKLLEAVGVKALAGEKAKAKQSVMTELDLAGAVSRNESRFKKIIS
jgi:hypothetical protein